MPDAGRLVEIKGDEILAIQAQIDRLYQQINLLRIAEAKLEAEAELFIVSNWTAEEIHNARLQAAPAERDTMTSEYRRKPIAIDTDQIVPITPLR